MFSLRTIIGTGAVLFSLLLIILISIVFSGHQQSVPDADQTADQWWEEQAEEKNPAVTGLPTVSYIPGGFRPEQLTITAGETVRFANFSATEMLIVSNDNKDKPLFDQREVGQEFYHTFEEAGQWEYKNQIRPTDTGIIVVKDRTTDPE